MNDVLIRAGTAADAEVMRDIHRAAVFEGGKSHYGADVLAAWAKPEGPEGLAGFRRVMSEGIEHFVLAFDDARALGFAGLLPSKSLVTAVYVAPYAMRRGIGRRLLAAIEAHAWQLQLPALELFSSTNAVAFYRSCGYVEVAETTLELKRGPTMACVQMKKAAPASAPVGPSGRWHSSG